MSSPSCKFEGCPKQPFRTGYCSKHYSRIQRHGDPSVTFYNREHKGKCSIEGCTEPFETHNMCSKHWGKSYNRSKKGRFTRARIIAERRSLEWGLSSDYYEILTSCYCYYCAGQLPATGVALDRIDNSKGYIEGNVVPCCTYCNRLKSDQLTESETLLLVKTLGAQRGSQDIWRKN